jgi:NADH pyrophosphatase NudC (nudix superfamily)
MLPTALIKEIDALLRQGELSHRRIASRLHVSRAVVSAIANGRRGIHGKEEKGKYSPLTPTLPAKRCPKCGHRVYPPCLICLVREKRERQIMAQLLARKLKRQPQQSHDEQCHLRAS